MGSQQKKKKRTKDVRSTTSEIKRTQDLDANKLALQPTFEIGYSPTGIGTIDFVNVTESINASQTNAPTAPAQVTGLNVTVAGDNQLNLSWTASGSPGVAYYNIYRSTTSGAEVLINSSSINSFSDITVLSGTTYYYKVSAVNSYGMVGTLSTEVSATTTGTINPTFWLKLDSNVDDASGNGTVSTLFSSEGYFLPGKFGTASASLNATHTPSNYSTADYVFVANNSNLLLDMTNGFSVSFWILPTTLPVSAEIQVIWYKDDTITVPLNHASIQLSTSGLMFQVYKNSDGTTGIYRCAKTGVVAGSWQHGVATFNGLTNTPTIYLNAVGSSTGSPSFYLRNGSITHMYIGKHVVDVGQPSWYKGRLDELQFFNSRVLTPTQITNLKNTNAP